MSEKCQLREIKFRALFEYMATGKKEWFYITVGCALSVTGYVQSSDWLQLTGLLDKQGKEIYEGDIVKYKARSYGAFYDEFVDVIVIGEVMFNYSHWRVERRVATPDNRMTPEFEFHHNAKYIEVIGNIYEHSYLLDTKKELKEK